MFRVRARASRNDMNLYGIIAMLLTQQILNGLLDGVYYLLIALGLSLIFSLGGIVNLAHGAFYAIGAYLTLVFSPYLGFGGSLVAAPVAVALLGMVIERTLFRRFYRSDPILSLLMTFGLAMIAEQALRMIFGAPPLSYSIPPWLRGQVAIGSFIYSFYRVVLLGIAAACVASLWFLLQKTSFGRVVRAGVQNPDMVGALGISLQPYMSAVAAIGIGLAGLAGVLLADLFHPSSNGPGDHHPGLRRRRDRRPRLVLGRGCGGAPGRAGQRHHGRHRLFRRLHRLDLSFDASRAAVQAARPVRRTHPALRVRAARPCQTVCLSR